MLTDPPACTSWCSATHNNRDNGWDISPGDITRVCRRVIAVQRHDNDQAHEITLERFAALVGGGALHIDEAIVRLDGGDAISLTDALLLSDCLRRVVDMAHEPSLAA